MIIQKALPQLSHLPKLLSHVGTPTIPPKSVLVDIHSSGFPCHHFGFSTENPAPQETPQSGKAIHLVLGLFPVRITGDFGVRRHMLSVPQSASMQVKTDFHYAA